MTRWKIGLPMYRNRATVAHRLLMRRIADGLDAAGWTEPVELLDDVGDLDAFWRSDALLLGQACGYPLMTSLAGKVRLIGTPCYDFAGCEGYRYCSFVVVAADAAAQRPQDLRGLRAAVNQAHSHSGMNALRHLVAPLSHDGRFFSDVIASGSHLASMRMVAEGQADVAAIDCITWGYMALHAPQLLYGLRILCETARMPGLPLISSPAVDDATAALVRQVLQQVLRPAAADDPAAALRLAGFAASQPADYQAILDAQRAAEDLLYPQLA
jgi:ABC-type phosphate/phosphonate transport system substrate-binding protein